MYKNNRAVWTEGMFLGPQHFQQHDRFLLNTISAINAGTDSYPFGLLSFDLDESALTEGKFSLLSVSGIFQDGTPYNLPDDGELPTPLDIGVDTRNSVIHLAIPFASNTDKDVTEIRDKQSLSQYLLNNQIVVDRQSVDSSSEETVFTGSLWTRLLVGSDEQTAYHTIPLARIVERRDDGSVLLDKHYSCCAMSIQASAPLMSYCREIQGLLTQRAAELADRLGQPTASDTSQFYQFLLLQIINRARPLLQHLTSLPRLHPERLYREMVQLVGELSTITSSTRQCPVLPEYLHRDQYKSFSPIVEHLRECLNWIADVNVVSIPVVHMRGGTYTASVADLHLFNTARFILAVKARVSSEDLVSRFPKQITISSKSKLKDLVQAQGQGIELKTLVNIPNSIPMHENHVYFEMRQENALWSDISTSGVIAMHIAGTFSELKMQLWAIAR